MDYTIVTIVRKIIVLIVLSKKYVINVATPIIAVDVQLLRNAKFVAQSSVLAVGQIILVNAWELIVVSVSSNVKVVPNLIAQTVVMAKKIMRLNSAKYVDFHYAPYAETVRKMSVMDARCALYEVFSNKRKLRSDTLR